MLKAISRSPLVRIYGLTVAISVAVLAAIGLNLGLVALGTALILAVLEISLSFDNAVVNATVLKGMSPRWQQIFLTVGILIAVVGVRVVLPILLVSIFAGIAMPAVIELVLRDPQAYGETLHKIHPEIAAFGGIFLLMLFLDYIFRGRPILWLDNIEKPLIKLGQIDRLTVVIALAALVAATGFADDSHAASMLVSGMVGLGLYLFIKGVGDFFENREAAAATAKSGLAGFLYLEVLDASFSLDGVLGAFAITSNILVITAGLGIGALWVRSMTIHLVKNDTLARFRYLEHGAHYAIGVLAALLLVSASREISEVVTGLMGIIIICLALADSVRANRKYGRPQPQ